MTFLSHIVHKNGHLFVEVETLMWQLRELYDKKQNVYLQIFLHRVRICHHFYHMSYFRPPWGAGGKGLLFRHNKDFEPVEGKQLISAASNKKKCKTPQCAF